MITINHSLNKLEQQKQLADLLQKRVGLLSKSEKLWEFIKKNRFYYLYISETIELFASFNNLFKISKTEFCSLI